MKENNLPELPQPDNGLADQWRKEFIEDLTERRARLAANAKGCQEGGWYRRQLEMQIALYDDALSAIAADRAKREGMRLTDDRIIFDALRRYKLSHAVDEFGGNYPLVDLLTPDGRSISEGEAEMELIADAIACALSDRALLANAPQSAKAPTGFDAEFLSKRLARVAKLAGVPMPDFSHEGIAEVAGTILGTIASKLEREEAMNDQVMRERDRNCAMADKLADAIAKHFGADIGEHSSANCPWHVALEVIDNAQANAPQVPDNLRNEVEKLTHWKHCMSYNDSYFGEPAGDLKRIVYQLERLIAAPQPEQKEG